MKLPTFFARFRKKDAAEEHVPEDDASDGEPARKIPLRVRFRAWWRGDAADEILAREAAERILSHGDKGFDFAGEAAAENLLSEETEGNRFAGLWTAQRIQAAESVWEEGFTSPGDAEYVLDMVEPLGLGPEMTILDLGAGLGGPARTLAEKFSLWVTAMEPCAELAEAGMEKSVVAGLAKRAPVQVCDPDHLKLESGGFDCIVSKETFFLVFNKRDLLRTISRALKPGGQLLFTDYLLSTDGEVSVDTENWIFSEPLRPELWSVKWMRDYLAGLRFDIRIEEDITDHYRRRLVEQWRAFVKRLRRGQFEEEMTAALEREAEVWWRRDKVLSRGEVRVYRFHAVKAK